MWRTLLLLFFFVIFVSPTAAQIPFACNKPTGNPPPPITFSLTATAQDAQQFNDVILNYLNTVHSADGLQAALIALTPDGNENAFPWVTAQVVEAAITGSQTRDVLTNISTGYPDKYDDYLSLYTCTGAGYKQLDTVTNSQFLDGLSEPGAALLTVADINNNQLRDIILYRQQLLGQKTGTSIDIYEWNGTRLAQTFGTGAQLGLEPQIQLANRDNNLATLELVLQSHYGYGQSDATAVIEITHVRPINEIYRWDGQQYAKVCDYFTDQPTTLYETLHSAETYRACGDYNDALTDYQQIWNGDQLTTWDENVSIVIPDSVTDGLAYAGALERAYIQAFAEYRMMQIALAGDDKDLADSWVTNLETAFPIHQNGYNYAATAKALWDTYQQTGNMTEACAAAETAYHNAMKTGDDPGIVYYETPPGSDYDHYGFYQYGDIRLSPDPDNLFDVPSEISDMIHIPVCLQ